MGVACLCRGWEAWLGQGGRGLGEVGVASLPHREEWVRPDSSEGVAWDRWAWLEWGEHRLIVGGAGVVWACHWRGGRGLTRWAWPPIDNTGRWRGAVGVATQVGGVVCDCGRGLGSVGVS